MRRCVSSLLKRRVAARQLWRCAACRHLVDECYEIDHRQPLWAGGSNRVDNLQALCHRCHSTKTLTEGIARGPSGSSARCGPCGRVYSLYFGRCPCITIPVPPLLQSVLLREFAKRRRLGNGKLVGVQRAGGKPVEGPGA